MRALRDLRQQRITGVQLHAGIQAQESAGVELPGRVGRLRPADGPRLPDGRVPNAERDEVARQHERVRRQDDELEGVPRGLQEELLLHGLLEREHQRRSDRLRDVDRQASPRHAALRRRRAGYVREIGCFGHW